ncbi:hypothetical protein ABZ642_06805 [Streptomyces sp. NPDC007157]
MRVFQIYGKVLEKAADTSLIRRGADWLTVRPGTHFAGRDRPS